MKLSNTLSAKQALSPSILHMMEIIQLNTQELSVRLFAEATENPMIDLDMLYKAPSTDLGERIDWLNSFEPRHEFYVTDADVSFHGNEQAAPQYLREELEQQVTLLGFSRKNNIIAQYLFGCIDDHGFLDEDPADVGHRLGVDCASVTLVLETLRSLSPIGICAKNTRECLLTQARAHNLSPIVISIIDEHLEGLSQGHYSSLAKKLNVSIDVVRQAAAQIKCLYPHPSLGLGPSDTNFYITPDVHVDIVDGNLDVSLTNTFTPYLGISQVYLDIYRHTTDRDTREYLENRLCSARQLFNNVSARESTLLKCAKAIAEVQKEFFTSASAPLSPMSLADIACGIDMSPSTVSRTVSGKYLQCNRGVLPIKSLFSKRMSSDSAQDISSNRVAGLLHEIIDGENKASPYSDAQICAIIKDNGINISRRTVANLRESLHISSSLIRKQH